jgi:hypothetical protein
VPEEPTLLAREEERLLALHGVGALVRHVEGVRGELAEAAVWVLPNVSPWWPELLEHALALLEQALLEVGELLLRHRLELLHGRAGGRSGRHDRR